MGRLQDRFGQPVTASSRAAIDAYVEGMDILLSAWPGADAHFDAALAADPDFALAHVARGRVLQMQGKGEAAAAAVSAANALVERLDDRERSHIHAVSLAIAGDGAGALDALKQHIRDWPRDAFVLSLTTGVYGLLGFSGARDHHEQQRDLLDSIAGHWDGDWWFLGYRGWAHAETGNAEFGAPLIEESLALRRANGNAAHGRAHAFYELGDAAGGAAFLDNWLPDYAANGSLYPHLSWHLALFALRLGDAAKAVALYDGRIDPALGKQPPFFAIIDSGAFNWRCLLRDVERPGAGLEAVSTFAEQHFPKGGIGFANVHIAYAHAAAGNRDALARHTAVCADNELLGVHPSAPAVHSICRGVMAFADGDYPAAALHLQAAMPDVPRIGGSHAQRDGVWETLVVAHLRAGHAEAAKELLEQRLGLDRFPGSWKQ